MNYEYLFLFLFESLKHKFFKVFFFLKKKISITHSSSHLIKSFLLLFFNTNFICVQQRYIKEKETNRHWPWQQFRTCILVVLKPTMKLFPELFLHLLGIKKWKNIQFVNGKLCFRLNRFVFLLLNFLFFFKQKNQNNSIKKYISIEI